MEGPKSVPNTKPPIPKPPKTSQNFSHPNFPPPPPPIAPQHRKRKRDDVDLNYLKIRALVKDMRPHFIEVLRTPDFRNGKAAQEIQKQMKLVMDSYKQMIIELVKGNKASEGAALAGDGGKSKVPAEGQQPLAGEGKKKQKVVDGQVEGGKQMKHRVPDRIREKSAEIGVGQNTYEKSGNGPSDRSCIIGGSNFGWNFIMYPGCKPVYYGVTKASHLASRSRK